MFPVAVPSRRVSGLLLEVSAAPIPPIADRRCSTITPELVEADVLVVVDDDAPCWRVAPVTTGGVGAVGVTAPDAVDGAEVPVTLVAVTVKV